MAHTYTNRIILVQLHPGSLWPLRRIRSLCSTVPRFGAHDLQTRYLKLAITTLVLAACVTAHAQAPIRDRSEAVSPIDGARRAADRANDALTAAENRINAAKARAGKAEQALAAAGKEQEAAKIEQAAAESELLRARKAESEAREALARAIDARK